MNLSDHFTLAELTTTENRQFLEENSNPPPEIIESLKNTAKGLELVRSLLGHPVHINSGYRCPALNAAVGGQKTSQHLSGEAADMVCPGFGTPREIAEEIAACNIVFDQCILEFDRWVHVSFSGRNRRQVLTINKAGTHQGIV